jgi:Ca2+-binding EF-hand superfamily protein
MGKATKKNAQTLNPMLAELVVADDDDDELEHIPKGSRITNPMLGGGADGGKLSASQMIEANESEMTDEELSELTYAFQAADMDGGGVIDIEEFELMLTVMGATITHEQTIGVVREAKDGFAAWKRKSDEEAVATCRAIWEEFDDDNSGAMDQQEVNAVVNRLKEMGANPSPICEADMANGELSFDQFMAWYLKQDTLPDEFHAPDGSAPVGGLDKKKKKGLVQNGVRAVLLPLKAVTKVASGPAQLLERSAKMLKSKDGGKAGPNSDASDMTAEEAMETDDQLIFAEFAFMVSNNACRTLSIAFYHLIAAFSHITDACGGAEALSVRELEGADRGYGQASRGIRCCGCGRQQRVGARGVRDGHY